MPIGMTSKVGWTEGGMAEWVLKVHDVEVSGRWVITNRRFVAVEGDPG
jgi:hypothetical protein